MQITDVKMAAESGIALQVAALARLALDTEEIKYVLQINDPEIVTGLLVQLIDRSKLMRNVEEVTRAVETVESALESSKGPDAIITKLKERLRKKLQFSQVHAKIAQLSGLSSWRDASDVLSEADILTILKTKKQYTLALQWNQLTCDELRTERDPETENLRHELLMLAHSEPPSPNFEAIETILKQTDDIKFLIAKTIPQIENWDTKRAVVQFTAEYDRNIENRQYYEDLLLGISLIKLLPLSNRVNYVQIISKPRLIVEQLLMNMEYSALETTINGHALINCDDLIEIYAKKAVQIQVYEEDDSVIGSDTTCISSSFAAEMAPFSMPAQVPSRDEWVPDHKVTHCQLCKLEKFTLLNRRRHCRRCGRVVCSDCSQRFLILPEISMLTPVRVCDDCFAQTMALQDRKGSINSQSSSIRVVSWVLSADENQNSLTRDLHYYEAAPSSSLCLSLIRLHTQKSKCVALFLDQIIKSLFEVLTSNQVDYGLVINIIKTLLLSTKVLCEENDCCRNRLQYIDQLLSRIDIVKMLINENCVNKDLINIIIFGDSQHSLVRLQERLLEMERFELALHIGMKHGLDVKGIWKNCAMICLKNGRLSEARLKFRHVLNEIKDSSAMGSNTANSKHIQDIMNTIQKCTLSKFSLHDRVKQIKSGKAAGMLTKDISMSQTMKETNLPQPLYEEALYYLNNYGSREDFVRFYSRFGLWKQALDLFLSKSNTNNAGLIVTFVNEFLPQVLTREALSEVLSLMKTTDPNYTRTWKYLISACKHFTKHRNYNSLYKFQCFMGDYLRAAITQVNCFYLRPPLDGYAELHRRADHLKLAIQHCQQFIDSRQYLHAGVYELSNEQVQRQIRAMFLQLEIAAVFTKRGVTGLLPFDCAPEETMLDQSMDSVQFNEQLLSMATTATTNSKTPLTLLDNSKARKTQLAAIVAVELRDSITEGFKTTQQIIKDHRLDAVFVYRLIGRILVSRPSNSNSIESFSQLLTCIKSSQQADEASCQCDEIVSACIRSCSNNEKVLESLIKMLTSDINKIDAYILAGKLKSAYLLAVRLDRVTDVTRILALAERNGQEVVRKYCATWLSKRNKLNEN